MRQNLDEDSRNAQFRELCAIFQQEQPVTLLVHGKVGVLVHERLQGVEVTARGLQPHTWWVEPEDVLHGNAE